MRHQVVCIFFEEDGSRCPHFATKTAYVPHLDLYVPCCDHCGEDYEVRVQDPTSEPIPPTPDPEPVPDPEPTPEPTPEPEPSA